MSETIIIGAGLTGLSTAYYLKESALVLEKKTAPGGLCASRETGGFTFDYAGHFLHLHDPHTKKLLDKIMPAALDRIARKASIFTHGRLMPYPFQANLYYLPEKIRKECLEGFLKRNTGRAVRAPKDFIAWSKSVFGNGITEYFMRPYNEKLWTIPGNRLTADWVAPFVPRPSVSEIVKGAEEPQEKKFGYNVSFYYPRKGGCGSLIRAFLRAGAGDVRLGVKAEVIDLKRRRITTSDGNKYFFENLVSTQPLVDLINSIEGAPADVRAAAASLRWNSVECLNLAFKNDACRGRAVNSGHWVYFPEKKYVFYRVGFYSNISPSSSPAGRFSMYVEISRKPQKRFYRKTALAGALEGLKDAGIIAKGARPELDVVLPIEHAYVIYDRDRVPALRVIKNYLEKHGVISIGRYGAWEYSFMESSIIEGKRTAEMLNAK